MERLTTDKAVENMNMVELSHNCCYAKDRKARYRDYDMDMDAREFAKNLLINLAYDAFIDDSDETFDGVMHDYLQYGTDDLVGLIALFYRNLWAMADLRETLKAYEDAEEQGLLLWLPCKVGDTVYVINKRDNLITEEKVRDVQYRGESYQKGKRFFMNIGASIFFEDEFGKLVFFDRKKAESALAEKGGAE